MNYKYELKDEKEIKAWEEQESIWCDLYMEFNDDNYRHCTNAFDAQGFTSAEAIELDNVDFIRSLIYKGKTIDEIKEVIPNASNLIKKYFS